MVLKTQCWLCLPGPRVGPAATGPGNGLWDVGQSSFWGPLQRGTNSVVSGRDILVEGCSEVGLGVCSRLEGVWKQLVALILASLHPPSSMGCCFLVLPPSTQAGREAAAGLVLSRSPLEVARVISGEPGGISHLPWAVPCQQRGFTLHPKLQQL